MTHPESQSGAANDPEGSIFLAKIHERYFAALTGRGEGADMTEEEKWATYERHNEAKDAERDGTLGELAIKAL